MTVKRRSDYGSRTFPDQCPKCGLLKERDEFPDSPSAPSGKYGYCKPCKSAYMREHSKKRRLDGRMDRENLLRSLKRYGVDEAWYLDRLLACGDRCEICGGGPSGTHKRLVIDHNHKTGLGRGLLCGDCNAAIGALGDNPERLRKAADYLDERGHYGA